MSDTSIELSEDAFDAQYPLVTNHLNPDAGWAIGEGKGCLFETFGHELDFVRQQDPRTVWTLFDGDDGDQYLTSGYHLVDRIGYLISTVPVPEGIDVQVRIPMQSEEDANDAPDLLAAVKDLLGDLPSVQHGQCVHCGRDYRDLDPDYHIETGDCPSDDCPSYKAREAIAKATTARRKPL